MSKFDYSDPGVDPVYCDNHSEEPGEFTCLMCENIEQDDEFYPYCSADCVRAADGESDEDENPRERYEDDGQTYGHPDDYRNGRE